VVVRCEGVVCLWRGVVEVDVEEQGVLVFGEALFEFARDGAVGRADVAVDNFADDGIHVCDLGELPSCPVV
jgi:hypothetical protein